LPQTGDEETHMKKWWIWLPVLFWLIPALPAQTLDEALALYYQANGGLEKLKALQSLKLTGKMLLPDSALEMNITLWLQAPDKLRSELRYQDQTVVQVFDGQTAWWIMPFQNIRTPQPMPDDRARAIRRQAHFADPLVFWREEGHRLELVGSDPSGEAAEIKLKLTDKDGRVIFFFLDAATGQLVRSSTVEGDGPSQVRRDILFSEFRPVQGLSRPFRVETRVGDRTESLLLVDSWEVDPRLEENRFRLPDVKPAK
jgi:hypothetical protein